MSPLDIFGGLIKLLTLYFEGFVEFFNNVPVEITWIILLFFCFTSILFFLKFFGEIGIHIYTVIAIIIANIQVLKVVKFSFFSNPVALGTILFASTFLCTDILAEHFSVKSAKRNILLGFIGFLFTTILLLFTIGFKPIDEIIAGEDYFWALQIQENFLSVFMPFPIFFIASMIAYLSSQFFDVWFYEKISLYTNKKFLWIRNNFSTIISSLIDNFIFSIFAWIILNPNPLNFGVVLFTYILGTYVLRILIAILDTPFIYISKYFLPKN